MQNTAAPGLFAQGSFFGLDENATPEMLEKKRALMAAMAPQYGKAKYVGEGLGQLATGIATGMKRRKMDKFEGEKRKEATGLFDRIMGGTQSSGGGMSILGPTPFSPEAAAPQETPAQSVANDAVAAIGYPNQGGQGGGMAGGIAETAAALGVDPVDLATVISYETAGTFDPAKAGPTTQWGQHRGLIQFGEPQAQQYGVDWNDPVGSQLGADGAVAKYLRSTGVKPGMGLLDIYSAVNAGGVGRYNRSDANNGGAPGTVRDKVENQMAGHRKKAMALFGGQGVQMASGPDPELAQALSNPWLTPEQKSIIQGQIDQQAQANDPLRQMQLQQAQMGLEKGQLEIEKLRNPSAPKMNIQELADGYKYYVDPTGQTPPRRVSDVVEAKPDVPLVDMSGANFGPQTDTRPITDKPEKGFQRRYDPAKGTWVDEAIPGGSKDTSEIDEKKTQNNKTSTSIISTAAGRARTAARNRTVGGLLGSVASKNPSSQNAEVYRQVEVLTANAKVSNLQAMREASKTGGALGAVSDKESAMLQAKSGALDPASPNFERDLDDYERTLLQVVHGFDAGNEIFEGQRVETISTMDQDGLLGFDIDSASPAEIEAWMKRMDEVGANG